MFGSYCTVSVSAVAMNSTTSAIDTMMTIALNGSVMHGLPVGGLSPGLELLSQPWADRARSLGDGGSGAG